jgi:hypothetical protein
MERDRVGFGAKGIHFDSGYTFFLVFLFCRL